MEIDSGQLPRAAVGPVLVGCYGPTGSEGLHTTPLDGDATASSAAHWRGEPVGHNLSWIEPLSDHRLVAVRELEASELVTLSHRCDETSHGSWQVDARVGTGGSGACHLAISPTDDLVAVAHYSSGSVALLSLAPEPALLDVCVFEHNRVDGAGQRQSHAHQCTWLDEHHLAVCDLGTDRVVIVMVDDKKLIEVGSVELPTGFGPRHLVRREDHAAVCGELSGEVASLSHDGQDWASGWTLLDIAKGSNRTSPDGDPLNIPSALVRRGDDLVLGNRGCNTIALVRWDVGAGSLTLTGEWPCGGDHPRDVVVHDDELWVANQHSNVITRLQQTSDGLVERSRITTPAPARIVLDW